MQSQGEVSIQKLAAFVGRTTAAKQAIQVFHPHLQALINRVVPLASSIEKVKQCYHQVALGGSHAEVGMVDAGDVELQWSSVTAPNSRVDFCFSQACLNSSCNNA